MSIVASTASATPAARTELSRLKLGTRLGFLIAGFAMACWAPLIPYARTRLGIDEAVLGLLILCLGLGSVPAMLFTGTFAARHGARPVMVVASLTLILILPLLVLASTPLALGGVLLVFGAALGSLDVSMNIHAVDVENTAQHPLMSGFHGMFSLGGFLGAACVTALLALGLKPLSATLIASLLIAICFALMRTRLTKATPDEEPGGPHFAMPRGVVKLLALLTIVTFLVEGALLDWSALLLVDEELLDSAHAGLGFMMFSVTMTIGRFSGDAINARVGDRNTLLYSSLIELIGFAVLLFSSSAVQALIGFALIGFGAANLVPVIFRRAGRQQDMPPALAIAAITTLGYGSILIGPTVIGFIAEATSLRISFWMLGALMLLLPVLTPAVLRGSR